MPQDDRAWISAEPIEAVFKRLKSSEKGLSPEATRLHNRKKESA